MFASSDPASNSDQSTLGGAMPLVTLGFFIHGCCNFLGVDPFHSKLDLFAHFETSILLKKHKLGRCTPTPSGRCSKPLDGRSNTSTHLFKNRLRRLCKTNVEVVDRLSSGFEQRPGGFGAHRPNVIFWIGLDASKLATKSIVLGKGRNPDKYKTQCKDNPSVSYGTIPRD